MENYISRDALVNYGGGEGGPYVISFDRSGDVTELKLHGGRFYPSMIHALAVVVNRHPEFRMALNEKGELGWFDQLSPSYTVFHPETETFSCLWTEYTPDREEFIRRYEEDLRLYGEVPAVDAQPPRPPAFNVSPSPSDT